MGVASLHFGSHVADPCEQKSLVDSFAGTNAHKTMPQNVPALDHFPPALLNRAMKVISCLVFGHLSGRGPKFLTAFDLGVLREQPGASGVNF